MHINTTINTIPSANINGQVSVDMALPHLSEGDSINARVIFSSEGVAHLKTAEGALIRARLDGGIVLPEGSEVTLTVEEKNADSVTLRIAEIRGTGNGAANTAAARQPSLPPALSAIFEQIQASGLPTAQKVELFTKALADFPTLNTQSAAVQQALTALSAQGNTQPAAPVGLGQMLVELAMLISRLENAAPSGQQANTNASVTGQTNAPGNTANATPLPGMPIPPAASPAATGTAATPATPVAEMPLPAGTANTAGSAPNAAGIPVNPGATALPGAEAAMPTATTAQAAETAPATATSANTAPTTVVTAPNPATNPASVTPATITAPAAEGIPTPAASAAPAAEAATQTVAATAVHAGETATPSTAANQPATTQPNAPPPEALQTVRQMVGELYPPGQSEPSPRAISQFIERLFARVGRTVEQGGEELQKCARELEVRLHLLKETISRSSLPQREELLNQTNRILQQTEVLREARLLCLQLPIQFEQQRQTAELYVYRRNRKDGSKLDPQNATILLALNTEHLGRLEALIQTRGKEINLKLEIARAEAVPLVREYSQALPRLLKEAGFKLNSASVEHLKQKTGSPQEAERALIEYQRNFDGKLDFFI